MAIWCVVFDGVVVLLCPDVAVASVSMSASSTPYRSSVVNDAGDVTIVSSAMIGAFTMFPCIMLLSPMLFIVVVMLVLCIPLAGAVHSSVLVLVGVLVVLWPVVQTRLGPMDSSLGSALGKASRS